MYLGWMWVEDFSRTSLQNRLDQLADEIIAQEGEAGVIEGGLDVDTLRLAIPDGGRLSVTYPMPDDSVARVEIGAESLDDPLVESISMGKSGSLRLEVSADRMQTMQRQAAAAVGLVVLVTFGAGVAVASVTARRLADPLAGRGGPRRPAGAGRLPSGRAAARDPRTRPRLRRARTPRPSRSRGACSASASSSATSPISCGAGSPRSGCGSTSWPRTRTRRWSTRRTRRSPRWIGSRRRSTTWCARPGISAAGTAGCRCWRS